MLSKPHKLMLYSLGQCYRQLNKRFDNIPLDVSISKTIFIDALVESGLLGKTPRAVYKNLERLQRRKYISYSDKELRFTERGYKIFFELEKEMIPYKKHEEFWKARTQKEPLQARLKQ